MASFLFQYYILLHIISNLITQLGTLSPSSNISPPSLHIRDINYAASKAGLIALNQPNSLTPTQRAHMYAVISSADKKGAIKEVILGTSSDTEGDATSLYLTKQLLALSGLGKKIKVTRIAHGVPVGSALEFVDKATLSRAFKQRQEV